MQKLNRNSIYVFINKRLIRDRLLLHAITEAYRNVIPPTSFPVVLLFLNRRGYAPLTLCRHCGHRFRCSNCDAWLVEHRFRRALICHHCGHMEPRPHVCPECEAEDALAACGPGVERLAEEAAGLFPDARVLVLSSDFPGGAERLRRELDEIAKGAFDLVIGTQLVAKGHNFPFLTLVGVVDADLGLGSGDPRAAERTFQLLAQVTGRAGRGDQPGRALIQTYRPDHPVISALLSGDAEEFYAQETSLRQRAGLPPFGRLAALIVRPRTPRSRKPMRARWPARRRPAGEGSLPRRARSFSTFVITTASSPGLPLARGSSTASGEVSANHDRPSDLPKIRVFRNPRSVRFA